MRRLALLVCVPVALAGCGRTPPTLAGGKPVSYWVQALKGPDAKLRRTAAFKLGNVGPADAATLPALIGALDDADPRVRVEAVLALVKAGPDAQEAVPALTRVQQHDRDARVRSCAGKAVERLRGAR